MIVDHPQLIAGRYQVDEELGRGGMGTVYAGHDLRLDRDVAVKVLRDDLARDPSFRQRFEREARAAARVTHPNVVAVYDTGDDGAGDTFIVMERLTGRTLGHELADGPLEEARLREVATAVLAALSAAHAEGIVHRDVKPGNILVAADGTLKVGDFGIATSLDAGDSTTRVPMGTLAYTAPERLRGFAATGRSDLYSLGVVLYEAASGAQPFTGDGAVAVAEAVVDGHHRALAERRPDLSAAFVAAVERALVTDPADRFADAEEMLAALTTPSTVPVGVTVPLRAPATETAVLPPPARSAPTPVAPVRRRRLPPALITVAIGIALVLAIAVGLLVSQGDDTATPPEPTTPTTVSAPVAGPPLPTSLADALDRLEEATQP